jgi:hypothetical protein
MTCAPRDCDPACPGAAPSPAPRPLSPWPIAACAAAVGLLLAVVAWGAAERRHLDCRAERHPETR